MSSADEDSFDCAAEAAYAGLVTKLSGALNAVSAPVTTLSSSLSSQLTVRACLVMSSCKYCTVDALASAAYVNNPSFQNALFVLVKHFWQMPTAPE